MISEKLGSFYAGFEDKWYGLVDSLEEKGVPIGVYADALDNNGIPSFPFTVALIVIIIAAIFALFFIGLTINPTINVTVTDQFGAGVVNPTITISDKDGKQIGSPSYGSKIYLEGIWPGAEITITISKDGYKSGWKTIKINKEIIYESITLKKELKHEEVLLSVIDEISGIQIPNAVVIVKIPDKAIELEAEFSSADKYYHLMSIPTGIDLSVSVEADGYEDISNQTRNFSGTGVETIYMSPKNINLQGVGKLLVTVRDSKTNEPIDRAKIQIQNRDTGAEFYNSFTENGEFLAYDIPKTQPLRVIVEKEGTDYLRYDSLETNESIVVISDEETLDIVLYHGGKKLTVYLTDTQGNILTNIKIMLYNSQNELISEQDSAFSGAVEFENLEPEETYYVVAYADGLLPARTTAKIADNPEVDLIMGYAGTGNASNVSIYVATDLYDIVENATVTFLELKDGAELPIGIPAVQTNLSGYVQVRAPVNIELVAKAVKNSMEGGGSTLVRLNELNEIRIFLEDTKSLKELYFVGPNGELIRGIVIVTAKDGTEHYNGEIGDASYILFDAQGNEIFDVYVVTDTGKEFSEEVNMSGLGYYEIIFSIKEILGLEPRIEFSSVLDEFGAEVEGISPGKYYWLKFETYWPAGEYKGGVHVRIGNDDIQFADSQDIGIFGFDAVVDDSFYGTSYTPEPPPGNEGIDRQNQGTPGEYNKWVDLYFDNPADSTVVKIKVQARETTSLDAFEVKFRIWGIIGSEYFRNPSDDILGREEYNFEKTGLYANTKTESIKILENPDAKCEDGICVSYWFRDEEGLEHDSSEFRPALNKNYELIVSILSEDDRNAKIKVSTDKSEPKLFITGYSVDDSIREDLEVTSVEVSGVRLAEGEEKIVTITFRTTAKGITKINLQLIAENTIINKEINLEVEGERKLELKVIPEEINVAENFTLEVKSQGKKITNATVHLHDSAQNIAATIIGDNTPQHGENGRYFFENVFAPGEYKFVVSAEGFASSEFEIEIKAEGEFKLEEEIVFNLNKQADVGTVFVYLENKANYEVNQISFELVNDREFSRNFTLEVDLSDVLAPAQRINVPFSIEYIGENPNANLYSETEVIIRGFISGTYEVLGTTTVKVSYNKKIDSDCLKFDKGALQLYMTGTAGTSKQIELSIENTCNTSLELSTRAIAVRGNPNIEITVNSVSINAGETQNVTVGVLNRIERLNAPPLNFSYSIVFESPRIAKSIPLNVLIWNPAFSLSVSDNLVLWLSKTNVEEKAKAMAPLFVRNTGIVPVEDIGFSIRGDDWRLNSISVSVVPAENIRGLMPGQPVSPTRSIFAEADIENSLAEPVFGRIIISGNIDGRRYDLRAVNVWIHVSGFECLKAWSDEDLIFQSAESSAGSISKIITVRNECAEEVNITSITPDKFGQNSIILHALSADTLRPNQQADFEVILQKRQDYNQENIKVVIKGLLVRTQKFVEAKLPSFVIKLGDDIQETSASTSPQEIPVCGSEDTKTIYYPLIGTDCSRNYCDAKSLALYLKDKLRDLIVEAKSKAYRGSYESANFPGCANNEYCSFTSLGIVPTAFTVFMQNDYMTTQVLQHELSNSGLAEVKNLRVSISDVQINSLSTGGWSSQLYVSDEIKGCGMYTFTLNGVMQVSNNRILEDNYIILLKSKPERQNTAECTNKIQNFINFLPIDEGYSVTENYNAWPGIVKQKKDLESLAESFSEELFGTEDRITMNPPNNKLVLDFGDTQGGILKLEIEKSGSQNTPKTVYAYINRAYETGDDELKEQIAEEVARAVTSLTEHSVDGCISEDESYFIIQSYEEFGELRLDAEDNLRLKTSEVCIDANVSSEFPEKVRLETDFAERVEDLGNSEAGVMYVKLKNLDGTEILKDHELDLVKEEGRELYEYEFKVCAKGSQQFNLAVENMKEIKLTATSVEVTGRGTRFQPVEKIIKFKVCVIHPYDLFRDMSNEEPGRYYATVGWTGEPNVVNSVDIWRALFRDNQINRPVIVENNPTNLDPINFQWYQNFIESKKWPALTSYMFGCTIVAGICGAVTNGGWVGATIDVGLDCLLPTLLYAGQDSALIQNIKNAFSDFWDVLSGTEIDGGESEEVPTPATDDPEEREAIYSDMVNERKFGVGLDVATRLGITTVGEINLLSAKVIAGEMKETVRKHLIDQGMKPVTINNTSVKEISEFFAKKFEAQLLTAQKTRGAVRGEKLTEFLTQSYNNAMTETFTEKADLFTDTTNWTNSNIPNKFANSIDEFLTKSARNVDSVATDGVVSAGRGVTVQEFFTSNPQVGELDLMRSEVIINSREVLTNKITDAYYDKLVSEAGVKIDRTDFDLLVKSDVQNFVDRQLTTIDIDIQKVSGYATPQQWTAKIKNPDDIKRLVNAAYDQMSKNTNLRNTIMLSLEKEAAQKFGKEGFEEITEVLAKNAKKLDWGTNARRIAANLLSWKAFRQFGTGVGCGMLSNFAGMVGWRHFWKNNYTDPNEQADLIIPTGPGNGIDDDGDGQIDEENCDGTDTDGDGLIDEDCTNILQMTIKKYSTYRIDIEQSVGGGRRVINIREITSEVDIQTMKEDLANGRATRLDEKYCNGEFMEKSIQIVYGSLSPPDSEEDRKTIYYNSAVQEPVVNAAIDYKNNGITEAMLMAIVFESAPPLHNLGAAAFETKIGEVAEKLRQLRVGNQNDDEGLLRDYAQNHGIDAGTLFTTFNKWTGYEIDWGDAYGTSSNTNLPVGTGNVTCAQNSISDKQLGMQIDQVIAANTNETVNACLLCGMIKAESAFKVDAGSSAGAQGLTQLMPATAQSSCHLSRENILSVNENINCGSRYLTTQIQNFGSVELGLAAYNCGPGCTADYRDGKRSSLPAETQAYVPAVIQNAQNFANQGWC